MIFIIIGLHCMSTKSDINLLVPRLTLIKLGRAVLLCHVYCMQLYAATLGHPKIFHCPIFAHMCNIPYRSLIGMLI